jgi:glycine C-acetyltransferase
MDGCRFSGAEFLQYRHQDMEELERCLAQAGGRQTLVVVDGVFSMDGDVVHLPGVVERCRKHGALLMVDEAHSFGVLGKTGLGVLEHFGLPSDAIDVKMGTLSKALCSTGGFVAGSRTLIDYLRHHARGYVFSGALPNADVAAAEAAIDVLREEPERLTRLWRNRERFFEGVQALGFDTFTSTTPIVPLATQTEEKTFAMTRHCRDHGLFVVPVFYPAVPKNAPRLRTCVMASHTDEDIDFALDVLDKAKASVRL